MTKKIAFTGSVIISLSFSHSLIFSFSIIGVGDEDVASR